MSAASINVALARRIRLVGLDVDGVLTDGGIYLGDVAGQRTEFKRYDIQDGFGINAMRAAGIVVTIVTGRESESVRLRAAELGIADVEQDRKARKLPALQRVLHRHGIALEDAAFVGDDIPDLAILRAVGLPVCVANASTEARDASTIQLTRRGGQGAVREFAEILLRARGEWTEYVERYVERTSSSHHVIESSSTG